MTTTTRPLAKALHTVTVVARVAAVTPLTSHAVARVSNGNMTYAEAKTWAALDVLGYVPEQVNASPALFAACVKAVQA